jgi:hypothetical protein
MGVSVTAEQLGFISGKNMTSPEERGKESCVQSAALPGYMPHGYARAGCPSRPPRGPTSIFISFI